MESRLWPLILAVPHSVSMVMNLISVTPVMESPLSITTVVELLSPEANRIPAISDNGS